MYYSSILPRGAFLSFVLCGVLAGAVTAQDADAEKRVDRGSWALQFQINDNFSLSSFQGSLLSVKWHRSENGAFRIGMSGNLESTSADEDGANGRHNMMDLTQYNISVQSQFLRHVYMNSDRLNFYFGAGPAAGIYSLERKDTQETEQNDDLRLLQLTRDTKERYIGISGVTGAEWFVSQRLSLTAEYGYFARYLVQSVKEQFHDSFLNSDDTDTAEASAQTFRLDTAPVRFGLSVYF